MESFTLDVREGTWMSVDVHPDGTELVFDLLGDIFVLPMDGGEARPISTGLAWDMQPRYSPDGRSVSSSPATAAAATTSGSWTAREGRLGRSPRRPSDCSTRRRGRDEQYVVARKHYTKTRSLGAGELWLYHHTGGSGVQLTKRPNQQKDLGEPSTRPTAATSTTPRTPPQGTTSNTTRTRTRTDLRHQAPRSA